MRPALSFEMDGARHFRAALCPDDLTAIEAALGGYAESAGVRVRGNAVLAALLRPASAAGRVASAVLGDDCFPVRAVLFDKTATMNWSLAWHQDRTIVVRERRDVPGFGPWTIKQGLLHVAPPPSLLGRMATLRIHLDAVTAENAPLLVALGSHRRGMIPEGLIDEVVANSPQHICLADRGDIWSHATLIVHASDAVQRPSRRRVLQVDYARDALPAGLEWLGI